MQDHFNMVSKRMALKLNDKRGRVLNLKLDLVWMECSNINSFKGYI